VANQAGRRGAGRWVIRHDTRQKPEIYKGAAEGCLPKV